MDMPRVFLKLRIVPFFRMMDLCSAHKRELGKILFRERNKHFIAIDYFASEFQSAFFGQRSHSNPLALSKVSITRTAQPSALRRS
jgi:hypothetical protein